MATPSPRCGPHVFQPSREVGSTVAAILLRPNCDYITVFFVGAARLGNAFGARDLTFTLLEFFSRDLLLTL